MLPSETQACASVTSAFLQVRPTCDRRAPHAQTRDVFLFSVLFADCASARCREHENVETGSGTRSSGASARGRGSARSIALDRSRARRPDGPDSRISAFSHARGAPRSTARRRSRRSGLVRRLRRVARNNTAPKAEGEAATLGTLQAHSKNEKRKTVRATDATTSLRVVFLNAPTRTPLVLESRFSRRFTSRRLGVITAGGTS